MDDLIAGESAIIALVYLQAIYGAKIRTLNTEIDNSFGRHFTGDGEMSILCALARVQLVGCFLLFLKAEKRTYMIEKLSLYK